MSVIVKLWKDSDELSSLISLLQNEEYSEARYQLIAYNLHHVPIAIKATYQLTDGLYLYHIDNTHYARNSLSMGIILVIAALTSSNESYLGFKTVSLGEKYSIPNETITFRNKIAHGNLASLSELEKHSKILLNALIIHFWIPLRDVSENSL